MTVAGQNDAGLVAHVAREYAEAGLSVMPITRSANKEEDKKPALSTWKPLQSVAFTPDQAEHKLRNAQGVGIICGAVSGNLEVLDFEGSDKAGGDSVFPAWCDAVKQHDPALFKRLRYLVRTPSGGWHVYYRCGEGVVEGNQKLAMSAAKLCAIETRGEGGYVGAPPTSGYTYHRPVKLSEIPVVSLEERETLLECARSLSAVPDEVVTYAPSNPTLRRPGDQFNADPKNNIGDMLERHGWRRAGRTAGRTAFTRPGKTGGVSATVTDDGECLYVFTSNAPPFAPGRSYTRFATYAYLEHGGDFGRAVNAIVAKGYAGDDRGARQAYAQPQPYPSIKSEPVPGDLLAQLRGSVTRVSAAEMEEITWLGEQGYFRRGQLNIVEARQGVGKTTFFLAWADLGQRGCTITGERVEPYRTLYLGTEDSPGDIRHAMTRYFGHDAGESTYVMDIPGFSLDSRGLTALAAYIREEGCQFVVIDPVLQFLPRGVDGENDNTGIRKWMAEIRAMAQDTGVAIGIVRHFQKYTEGKDVSSMGAGGNAWAASSRGQIALLPHPDPIRFRRDRYVMAVPRRGSLTSKMAEPIGYSMADGIFGWIQSENLDYAAYAAKYNDLAHEWGMGEEFEQANKKPGPKSDKFQQVKDALSNFLGSRNVLYREALEHVTKETGASRATVYRAKESLGIIDASGHWSLPVAGFSASAEPDDEFVPYWNNDR